MTDLLKQYIEDYKTKVDAPEMFGWLEANITEYRNDYSLAGHIALYKDVQCEIKYVNFENRTIGLMPDGDIGNGVGNMVSVKVI